MLQTRGGLFRAAVFLFVGSKLNSESDRIPTYVNIVPAKIYGRHTRDARKPTDVPADNLATITTRA